MTLLVINMCFLVIFAWRSFKNGGMDGVEVLMLGIPALIVALACLCGIVRIYSIHHGRRGMEIEMMADE